MARAGRQAWSHIDSDQCGFVHLQSKISEQGRDILRGQGGLGEVQIFDWGIFTIGYNIASILSLTSIGYILVYSGS